MATYGQWQQLSEHLYLFGDTCNVYAMVHDGEAVLVDFGSGSALDHLSEIGAGRVVAILHTHHHRDQCQGDGRAVAEGIPICACSAPRAGSYLCLLVLLRDRVGLGRGPVRGLWRPDYALFSPANRHFEDGERVRFIEHSMERLRDQYGVRRIEAVLPSHYHDDHVNGIPYLQRELGAECWAYENMREILENPRGELIGCVMPTPVRVQRTFRDGERLQWRGLEFTIHYTPGHADYHMGMFGMIDGHSVAFSGDNLFPLNGSIPDLIYRNHVHKTSHQQTARLYLQYMPEILCAGHDLQHDVKPGTYQAFAAKSLQLTQLFERLLPDEANLGLEPSWTQIYPYQSQARPGDTLDLEVRMTSFLPRQAEAEVRLVPPEGWSSDPGVVRLTIGAGERSVAGVRVHIPVSYRFRYPRVAIAADAVFDSRHMGQICEATVEQA